MRKYFVLILNACIVLCMFVGCASKQLNDCANLITSVFDSSVSFNEQVEKTTNSMSKNITDYSIDEFGFDVNYSAKEQSYRLSEKLKDELPAYFTISYGNLESGQIEDPAVVYVFASMFSHMKVSLETEKHPSSELVLGGNEGWIKFMFYDNTSYSFHFNGEYLWNYGKETSNLYKVTEGTDIFYINWANVKINGNITDVWHVGKTSSVESTYNPYTCDDVVNVEYYDNGEGSMVYTSVTVNKDGQDYVLGLVGMYSITNIEFTDAGYNVYGYYILDKDNHSDHSIKGYTTCKIIPDKNSVQEKQIFD